MATTVWYKPPEGKKVPRFPGQSSDDYFPPHGAWTTLEGFIQRMILRNDGELIEGGAEHLDAAYFAQMDQEQADRDAGIVRSPPPQGTPVNADLNAAAKPTTREEAIKAAKEKLRYNPDKPAPDSGTAAAVTTTDKAKA